MGYASGICSAFQHKLWKRCFSFKKNDFRILLASVDKHYKNWAEILEWISISGRFRICGRFLSPWGESSSPKWQLPTLCGSQGTYWQERNLPPAEENSSLNCLSPSLAKREESLRTKVRPQTRIMMPCLRARVPSGPGPVLWLSGTWPVGDCQLTFFGKSSIQSFYSVAQWEKSASLSSSNFWSKWMDVFRVDFVTFYNFNTIFTNIVNFFSPGLSILSFFNNYSDRVASRPLPLVSLLHKTTKVAGLIRNLSWDTFWSFFFFFEVL